MAVRLSLRLLALGAAAAAGLSGAPVHAGGPSLEINWSVNGGPASTVQPPGEDMGGGVWVYEGSAVDEATGLELTFDLAGNPESHLSGNLSIVNELSEDITVVIAVTFSFSPRGSDASDLAASVAVGLTTGPGGGMLSSLPPYLWQALVDEEPVGSSASLFFHPFHLSHSGAGSSSTTSDFGLPDPVEGPQVQESIGFEIRFALTDGDRASCTSLYIVDPTGCAADLDGDGNVGIEDLAMVLGSWGECPDEPEECPADLDGDGEVGISDLLLVVAAWGPCP